jgi:hypothetical protein
MRIERLNVVWKCECSVRGFDLMTRKDTGSESAPAVISGLCEHETASRESNPFQLGSQ